jgi:hypothetical protein
MALVSMRELLDHAAEHGYGIPAFNVNLAATVLAPGGGHFLGRAVLQCRAV